MSHSIEGIEQKLKDEVGQMWKVSDNRHIHRDQFGNEIHRVQNGYILYRKQEKVIKVNKLHAAKLISSIILNDIVHYKKID